MLTGQELFGPEGTARLTGRVCDRVRPEGPATMTRGGLGVLIPGFGTQLLYAIVVVCHREAIGALGFDGCSHLGGR